MSQHTGDPAICQCQYCKHVRMDHAASAFGAVLFLIMIVAMVVKGMLGI